MSENQKQQETKTPGFWQVAFQLLLTPVVILTIAAVASIIFGGRKGLGVGLLLLWCVSIGLFPSLFGERLIRRFGTTWGIIIAAAPLWLPGVIALLWLGFGSN
jgi:hypothetical protein